MYPEWIVDERRGDMANPILVTGAAGRVGGIGRRVTELLLNEGKAVLNWSGLPVVHVRPTVLLDGFFLIFTADSVRESNQIRLPLGEGKTSPVTVEDVARVIAALLANPQPHIGKIYHLTGPQSENMNFYGGVFQGAWPHDHL